MPIVDLNTGAAKLGTAMKSLMRAWEDASQHWNDASSRAIEENYLKPLEPRVKAALDSTTRIAEMLNRAEQECQR